MTRRFSAAGIWATAAFLLCLVATAFRARYGAPWRLSSRAARGASYALAESWDGVNIPSGKLQRPIGIAIAPDGNVYVTDARARVVRFGASGEFKAEWGKEGNGPGEFGNPIGVAVAQDGSVFVSDYDQDRIQKFTADGRFLLAFGGSGSGPGQFKAPAGLAVDPGGFLYVADFYNDRIQKFTPSGSFVKVIGHPGRIGPGALHYPTGASVTPDGQLVVADAYNYQLQWLDLEGQPVRRAGYHLFWFWPKPVSSRAGFNVPSGVAVNRDGLIHVADSGNHRIVMLSPRGESLATWAIPDADPKIYSPEQVAISPDGTTVYATDLSADRVLVLKIHQPSGPTS